MLAIEAGMSTARAVLNGLPLSNDSRPAKISASRCIKSASFCIKAERSAPDEVLHGEPSLKALLAAATATFTSAFQIERRLKEYSCKADIGTLG